MLAYKFYLVLFALKIATCSCHRDRKEDFREDAHYKIQKIGKLNSIIDESSGIIQAGNQTFWTHNDSGGEPALYRINEKGELLESKTFPTLKNHDWEDITSDPSGNLYIGDFGNNSQKRTDLCIWKLEGEKAPQAIRFQYEDQTEFPGNPPNFDCEALFEHEGFLYLFSKDWSKKNLVTKMYKIPAITGTYTTSPVEKQKIDKQVTGAAKSPSGHYFALQTYGKMYIYGILDGKISFDTPLHCIKTGRKQTEAVTFLDDSTLVFTNEQGNVYRLKIKK